LRLFATSNIGQTVGTATVQDSKPPQSPSAYAADMRYTAATQAKRLGVVDFVTDFLGASGINVHADGSGILVSQTPQGWFPGDTPLFGTKKPVSPWLVGAAVGVGVYLLTRR
jgi:hypothetical protein